MKNYPEARSRTGVAKLSSDDFVQAAVAVQMQVGHPALKVHRKDQPHQAKVMITVKVTDKDMIDAVKICLHAHKLDLGCFTTVNEKSAALYFDVL